MEITVSLVQDLIRRQFPQWAALPVRPVEKSGHDNRTFHLGDAMAVRLPSGPAYQAQAEKEARWLPYLQAHLDFPVSAPLAAGRPEADFPYPWSVNQWIEGDVLRDCEDIGTDQLARDLAAALRALQRIDCSGGPAGGEHNFFRGCSLRIYSRQTLEAVEQLKDRLPAERLLEIWAKCLSIPCDRPPVWVHGDIAPGNILMRAGRFYGLIDFGILGTGDPACDYAMAWTYFKPGDREVFLDGLDEGTRLRAMGWALWKALITYDDADPAFRDNARLTVQAILGDKKYAGR